jgi:biotin carboxyl carrier protein
MTSYEIVVNGKSYEVTVQKKRANAPKAAVTVMSPVSAVPTTVVPAAAPAPAPVLRNVSPVGNEGKKVLAPMPGKVIAIKVNVGDQVKKGQELIIMEAMKMHNPIRAANDGVITELLVQVNDSVQSGQALISVGAIAEPFPTVQSA